MRRGACTVRLAAALLSGVLGCDDGPPPGPAVEPPPEWNEESAREAEDLAGRLEASSGVVGAELSVRLAFGAGADLDLYVTGPQEETVYYANTPSGIGGELLEDRRCVHDTPRIETARFPAPLMPGRYRIGIDYPHACSDAKAPMPFALRVDEPGGHHEFQGLAAHRVFEAVVLEFEIGVAPVVGARQVEEVDR